MRRRIRPNCLSLAIGMLLLMVLLNAAQAQDTVDAERARLAEQGEAVFQQKCSTCHTIGGGDTPMGPDLAGVTERRDRQWLQRIIMEPGELIAEGDPLALRLKDQYGMAMPDMGLSRDEVEAVLAFLAHPGEAEHHAGEALAESPQKKVAQGDPERGKALYVGTASFANGGAPCLACHGIGGAGLGMAAGASYGPDLTDFYQNYGAEGVVAILETLPFPSMEPIYAKRPLTEKEQQNLTAFFAAVSKEEPVSLQGAFILQAGGAFVAFGVLLYFAGRGRLRNVRRSLVEQARKTTGGQTR